MPIRLALACAFLSLASLAVADWPQFRGHNSSGIADKASVDVPIEFGPGLKQRWCVPIASGHSSPCVSDDAIYLTTFESEPKRLSVVSLDRGSGDIRWTREVPVSEIETGHPSFNPASSTAATDGDRVVAYFGSFGLVCFNREGKELWQKRMPLTKSYAGNATSPAIIGDRVILYRGNHVDHFLMAVDKKTGETLWKVDQAEPFSPELACTSCPIIVNERLIVHTARSLQAFDIHNGQLLWVAKCATTATSTPVIHGGDVIVAAWNKMGEPALRPSFPDFDKLIQDNDRDGDARISREELPRLMIFHRPEGAEAPQNGAAVRFRGADRNGDGRLDEQEWRKQLQDLERFRSGYQLHGLLAIPIDSAGVVGPDQIRTLEREGIPEVPSPITKDGLVYLIKNGGLLTCIDLETGERLYRKRTGGRGTHYASPVIAEDRIYCTAGNGTISVIKLGREPEVLATNDMDEPTYATPAIADGILYVRTHTKLYAFGK